MTEGIPFQRGSRLRRVGIAATVALILGGSAALTASGAARSEPQILTLEVADAIQPVTAQYVVNSLREAKQLGCDLIILKLDTPGGLLSSTETIVRAITGSPVPVVVFVSGTHAASAGFFITIAADVAVMAPGTRFGAAHPVLAVGDVPKDSPMMAKIENDLAAYARSLATNRRRNEKEAELAVRKSSAFTEREALKLHLIDYVCRDENDIITTLDGKTIRRFDGRAQTLHLTRARIQSLDMSLRDRLLRHLADPTMALLLLFVGIVGLYIEFTHPGMIAPGVVGAICLLLFALVSQILPMNWGGVALVVAGIIMFLLELKVPSYGTLTAGGIVCLVLGALVLFKSQPGTPQMGMARL